MKMQALLKKKMQEFFAHIDDAVVKPDKRYIRDAMIQCIQSTISRRTAL